MDSQENKKIVVVYFTGMGSSHGCESVQNNFLNPIASLLRGHAGVEKVEVKCYQAPGEWIAYHKDSLRKKDAYYQPESVTKREDGEQRVHIELKEGQKLIKDKMNKITGANQHTEIINDLYEYNRQYYYFIFVGGSNGCIPATHFATEFYNGTLALALLSCVPAQEQWNDFSWIPSKFPIMVTAGSKEQYFGGQHAIYDFAKTRQVSVFAFKGAHLREPVDFLRALAGFVVTYCMDFVSSYYPETNDLAPDKKDAETTAPGTSLEREFPTRRGIEKRRPTKGRSHERRKSSPSPSNHGENKRQRSRSLSSGSAMNSINSDFKNLNVGTDTDSTRSSGRKSSGGSSGSEKKDSGSSGSEKKDSDNIYWAGRGRKTRGGSRSKTRHPDKKNPW